MHRVWCLKGNNKYGAESFWMLISEPMLRNLHTWTREREGEGERELQFPLADFSCVA
jgi:hypothetical protein